MLQDFSEIIGHSKVLGVLERMKKAGKLPHAMLIVGPHHIGKTLVATSFIKSFYPEAQNLEQISDYIEIKREIDKKTGKKKSQISVKQIRKLSERLAMSSFSGKWKTVFIEEAGALSIGAANALLKTLEEPKGETLIVLRAPSVQSVPATIASRCQIIRLSIVDRDTISNALETKGMSKKEAENISSFCQGRPGVALRYIKETDFRAEFDLAVASCLQLLGSDFVNQLSTSNKLIPKDDLNKNETLDQLLSGWQTVLRDLLLCELGQEDIICHQSQKDNLQSISKTLSQKRVFGMLTRIQETKNAITSNINSQLGIEHVLMH